MLFPIELNSEQYKIGVAGYKPTVPSDAGLKEKDIEHWLAEQPRVLLPNEEVLVIARSISGEAMADVIALDSAGRLVIVEIKRDWSSRETIGQLLEYAARLRLASYDELQEKARKYRKQPSLDLHEWFCSVFEGQPIPKEQLGKRHRLLIVSPDADPNLKLTVDWLHEYGVPVEFVPFTVYADVSGTPRFLSISGATHSPDDESPSAGWAGHWIFNTNETHAPGAYEKMFAMGVAAIYGYPNGPQNLEGSQAGNLVLAYVNQRGLMAVGRVKDGQVRRGQGRLPRSVWSAA